MPAKPLLRLSASHQTCEASGQSKVGETQILIPRPSGKKATPYQRQKARRRFRKREGFEPIIGHLKSDYRLMRNYLKGTIGDSINLMLAAAACNCKKRMREVQLSFAAIIINVIFRNHYLRKVA